MLKKEEYLKTVRRPYPPLLWTILLQGVATYKYYENIIDEPFAIRDMLVKDSVVYYAKKEVTDSGEFAFKAWKNPKKFKNVQREFEKRAESLMDAAKGKDFIDYCKKYEAYMPALILVWTSEIPLVKELRKLLSKKLSKEEVDSLMGDLNIPLRDNFYKKEEADLVKAIELDEHVKEYEWIYSRYGYNNPYTVEQAKEKLKSIGKEGFMKKYHEEKEKLRKTIEYAKEILGKDAYLIDFMQYVIYYRTQRTDIMNKSSYLAMPMFENIAKSLGLTYEQILYCTRREIEENSPPEKEIINKRMEEFGVIVEDGKVRCVIGKEYDNLKDFLKEDFSGIKEIKGVIACRGVVKGKVKKIYDKSDFSKIKKGDILVTSMTTPDMIRAMKLAGAFVTNEGGITCHAAIISREMNKPCIIGTGNATDMLEDSDYVEVDADKGIVRKLGVAK